MLFDELKHAKNRLEAAREKARQAEKAAGEFIEKSAEDGLAGCSDMLHNLKETLSLKQESETAEKKVLKEKAKLDDVSRRAKEEGLPVEESPDPE